MKAADRLDAANQLLNTRDVGYFCRLFAQDSSNNHPIRVIAGNAAPAMTGDGPGYEKVSGPCAGQRVSRTYARKNWRDVRYCASTLTVEVGADWLLAHRNRMKRRTDAGVTMITMPGRTVRAGEVRIIPGWINGVRRALAVRGRRTYHMERGAMKDMDAAKMAAEATAAWEKQDAHKKLNRFFLRDLKTTRVTLHDSRHAGNCTEGSLRFAEHKLGIPRQEVLAAGHLLNVSSERVMAVANGQHDPAYRACYAAWLRETIVSI